MGCGTGRWAKFVARELASFIALTHQTLLMLQKKNLKNLKKCKISSKIH